MTAFDAATLAFYDAEAATYAARWDGAARPQLARFMAMLPPGASVLELGCGGGQDAAAMIAAGFDVDPTDGSVALAAEAERRLGRSARVMRFDELDADTRYDAVWAAACLLHVPRAALPGVLARIWRALKPNGLHVASYKATGTQGRDRFGRLFNQLTADELRDAYARSGSWEIVAIEELIGGGYDGVETPWIGITTRKAATGSSA